MDRMNAISYTLMGLTVLAIYILACLAVLGV